MHEVLVNRLGGLSLPRKSVVRLTDRPAMTLDVYRGRKTTMQQMQLPTSNMVEIPLNHFSDAAEKLFHFSSNKIYFAKFLIKFTYKHIK